MRITGILLILIGVPLIGWFGYVELFYLDEIKSGFEEQRIKSGETINSKIKEAKDKFNKVKDNLKKRKNSKKKIAQVDAQLNDLIEGLKTNYQNQEKATNEMIESSISTVRNEYFPIESGIVGLIMILIGGGIIGAFMIDRDNTEEDKEISIEENLTTPKLPEPKLIEAKLLKANMSEANLSEANLSDTNLIGVNLSKVNLSGANLSGTNLSKVDLTGANLTKADLTGAKLVDTNLTGADLNEANLNGANLTGANLSGANLSKANLTGVNLRNSYIEENLTA